MTDRDQRDDGPDQEPLVDLAEPSQAEADEITEIEAALLHPSAPPAHSPAADAIEAWLRRAGERPSFFPEPDNEAAEARLSALRELVPSRFPPPQTSQARPPSSRPAPGHVSLTPRAMAGEDEGALAALRTIRKRAPTGGGTFGRAPAGPEARATLLMELADAHHGSARAHLLDGAAELCELDGKLALAATLRERALRADPRDPVVLRRVRQAAIERGDHERAQALLEQELALPTSAAERSLTFSLLSELQRGPLDRPQSAEHSARRAAAEAPSDSLPQLLIADAKRKAGRPQQAARALVQALGQVWPAGAGRAAIALTAARWLRQADAPDAALSLLPEDRTAGPLAVAIAFERLRAARAGRRLPELQASARSLSERVRSRRARWAALRLLATLQREHGRDPAAAVHTLAASGSTDAADLRLRALCALQVGNGELSEAALARWADNADAPDRALCLCELAKLHAQRGQHAQAHRLVERALAGSPAVTWVQLVREELARTSGDARDMAEAVAAAHGNEGLAAAAKLARSEGDRDLERSWLARASEGDLDAETARTLSLDITLAYPPASADAAEPMRAWTQSLAGRHQLGGVLLAAGAPASPAELTRAGLHPAAYADAPAMHAARLAHTDEPAARLALYRAEAEQAQGLWAATCQWLAADLARAVGDDTDAYERAALAADGGAASLLARKRSLTRSSGRSELAELAELEQQLMAQAHGRRARASYAVRAAALCDDPHETLTLLHAAHAVCPDDLPLSDLLARMTPELSVHDQVALLESDLDGRSPMMQRVALLRAAAALELGDEPGEAAQRYREVLQSHPDDTVAWHGLLRCLGRGNDRAALAEALRARAETAPEPAQERCLAYAAALVLSSERDERAIPVLQDLLARSGPHVPSLHALERLYLATRERSGLMETSQALSVALDNRRDRTAYLHAIVRELWQPAQLTLRDDIVLEAAEQADRSQLWFGLVLESAARSTGDQDLAATAVSWQARSLSDPIERACLSLRAAGLREVDTPEAAIDELTDGVDPRVDHPLVAEELARLYQLTGQLETAAQHYLWAAERAIAPRRAVRLAYLAACLYQDELAQVERARDALVRVTERDVGHRHAFVRLRRLLEQAGDQVGLAELLRRRLNAEPDQGQRVELCLSLYTALAAVSDTDGALCALREELDRKPGQVRLLERLGRALCEAGRHAEATEPLIELAGLIDDREQLYWVFQTLGEIYQLHVHDLRRAEIAYTRCVGLDDENPSAIAHLVEIYRAEGRSERAVRALQRLIELSHDDDQREQHTLSLVELLVELDQAELAERLLEDLRRKDPTRLLSLRALNNFYVRRGDENARRLYLARAAQGFRNQLEADPRALEAFRGLFAVAELRGQHLGAARLSTLAQALGVEDADVSALTSDARGMPEVLSDPTLQRALHPPLLTAALPLLTGLGPLATAVFREGKGLEAHHKVDVPPAFSAGLAQASRALGMPVPQVHAMQRNAVYVIGTRRPTLLVEATLLANASEAEARALCLRALVLVPLGLSEVARLTPDQFSALFDATARALDAHYGLPEERRAQADAIATPVARALDRKRRRQLSEHLFALAGQGQVDPATLLTSVWQLATRISAIESGDGAGTLSGLLRLGGDQGPHATAESRAASIMRTPIAHDLLSFCMSETALALDQRPSDIHPAATTSAPTPDPRDGGQA